MTAQNLTIPGLGDEQSQAKAELFEQAQTLLGRPAQTAWFVPGRIEFLGKHTDYAGGRSLICPVEQGFCILAAARDDQTIRITTAGGEQVEFDSSPDLQPRMGHWSNYPMTVARRVARNFAQPLRGQFWGADIAFLSDLPPAAGMSSSSGLITATFLVLADLNNLRDQQAYRDNITSDTQLAEYLGMIENGQSLGTLVGDKGVGTFGGSQDHTAIVLGQAEGLVQYGFCPVRFEQAVPLPAGTAFVIASSGVIAEKTGAALERYNSVSQSVSRILQRWREQNESDDRCLAAAVRSSLGAPDRLRAMASDEPLLRDRLEQFLAESERIIPAAADALADGRLDDLGRLVDESQHNAERWLGNQVPETAWLAAEARRLGAIAASAFGAGFGGSVWALVRNEDVARLLDAWRTNYAEKFPEPAARSRFFVTRSGPPATKLM